ncbi:unnamed protein product, partial [marine sediment metagenome]
QGRGSIAAHNIIEVCNDLGIQFWGHIAGKAYGNTIYDCRVGLGIFHDSHWCLVTVNTVDTTLEEGIMLNYTDETYYPYENEVSHNIVRNAGTEPTATYPGVLCRDGCGEDNDCVHNKVFAPVMGHAIDWYSVRARIADNTAKGWPAGKSGILARSDYQKVHHNILDGESVGPIGLVIQGDRVDADHNTVENCPLYGVQLHGCTGVTVKDNPVHNCGTPIIETGGATGNTIEGNPGAPWSGEHLCATGVLTAGVANAIAFAWQNPHAAKILI